eukprot:5023682-Heterocapsa_arctica.AAC.1
MLATRQVTSRVCDEARSQSPTRFARPPWPAPRIPATVGYGSRCLSQGVGEMCPTGQASNVSDCPPLPQIQLRRGPS